MKFKITVIAVQEDESVEQGSVLGTVVASADTLEAAQSKAREELWDSRLDSASCLAVFKSVPVDESYWQPSEMAPMEFLVTIQYGDDEDTRDDIVCDVTSADAAEAEALAFGEDVRIVAVYQRVR